jgi:hypothetical protein
MNDHAHEGPRVLRLDGTRQFEPFQAGFEIYGVRVALGAPREDLLDRLIALLPPGLPRCEPAQDDAWFVLLDLGGKRWSYRTRLGPNPIYTDLALVVAMIDSELRRHVADNATKGFFIHAGVVAHHGRAIVMPGDSFSGKTTLVAELVRAGAAYYSDEYAVIDAQGLVHPYARPLSIRRPRPHNNDRSLVESLGGKAGVDPVPVGVIAAITYHPDADFSPERRSAGQGMLTLLAHSAVAHEHPQETLAAAREAASRALVVEGDRGEAADAAPALLQLASEATVDGAGADR